MNWISAAALPPCRIPAVPALEGALLGNGASTALDPRVNTPGAWRFWDMQTSSFGLVRRAGVGTQPPALTTIPDLINPFPKALVQEVFHMDSGIIESLMQRRRG